MGGPITITPDVTITPDRGQDLTAQNAKIDEMQRQSLPPEQRMVTPQADYALRAGGSHLHGE